MAGKMDWSMGLGAETVIARFAVAVCEIESVTCTVKLDVAAVVGVPEIVPKDANERPAGSDPAVSDHV